jgi:hypothetical protein
MLLTVAAIAVVLLRRNDDIDHDKTHNSTSLSSNYGQLPAANQTSYGESSFAALE